MATIQDTLLKLKRKYSWNYAIKGYYYLFIEAYFLTLYNKFDEAFILYDELIKLYPRGGIKCSVMNSYNHFYFRRISG